MFCFFKGGAQNYSNFRSKLLLLNADSIQIDTLSIVTASEIILNKKGKIIPSEFYHLEYTKATLRIDFKKLISDTSMLLQKGDSISISYRTLAFNFDKEYYNKAYEKLIRETGDPINPFAYSYHPQTSKDDLFKTEGLNKSGSISRGIMFGTNQDLSVNSNLNLNLSGKINEKFTVLAAISDNNIPIQPEGNTQQLQNFDQVFIQLSDEKTKIVAGDFQLTKPKGYFMNFYKRAQGASVSSGGFLNSNRQEHENFKLKVNASAAVSKGKFSRNVIQGLEGNQGPYRLKGAENEVFIIVLSGTENIYVDGKLLLRGQENDYIIDYNTAEVTFTAKQLITKDKRIVAEFQYTDKNYARSLLFVGNELENNKVKLRFNIYSEQDAKNQPLQQDLSAERKLLLMNIGDSVHQALFSSADSVGYTAGEILYKKMDTLVNGISYSPIYLLSSHPDSAFYRLSFSIVGPTKGNYVQIQNGSNGRVFKWIPPINGVPQGNYEPVILMVTPKKRQMLTTGAEIALNANTKADLEFAYSSYDVNTFSEIDNKDNNAIAIKGGITNSKPIGKTEDKDIQLKSYFNYEMSNKNFAQIERFRKVEFERDWNLLGKKLVGTQTATSSGIGLESRQKRIAYELESFHVTKQFIGLKNALKGAYDDKYHHLDFSGSYLAAEGDLEKSGFLRHQSRASKKLKYFTLGIWEDQETNKRFLRPDTLSVSSYKYFEWEAYVSNPDTFKNQFHLGYKQRFDYLPSQTEFRQATFGESYHATFGFFKHPNATLSTNSTYRKLVITDLNLVQLNPENTLLNRIEYALRFVKGTFLLNSFYEVGSGLELKKEFSFIEVPAGQGVYAYLGDLNNNGIKDLNEFEVSPLQDLAKYIKIYTPTNEYVKVYSNQFSQTFTIHPEKIWDSKTGLRKAIARFSNQTIYRIDRRTNRENFSSSLNPFFQTEDSTLVSLNSSVRNTLFFNRINPVFGADISINDQRNKSLLTNGFEARRNNYLNYRIRWNIARPFLFNLNYSNGIKSNESEFFSNRNFKIYYYDVEPKISWQTGTAFRWSMLYKFTTKENIDFWGGERLKGHTVGTELKYNVLDKGNLVLNVNYIINHFITAETSLISFEMLEGLQPGKNITWNLTYNRNLSNNTQLSINYIGRNSQSAPTVHTGGVQVRAFF